MTFMKKIALLSVLSWFALQAQAQQATGKVVYERVINMHKRLPPEAEQYKAMIPETQSSKWVMLFTPSQSYYKAMPQQEDQLPEATANDGGPRMSFRFGGADNSESFRDYDNLQLVESRELGPKMYLIEDSLQELKWKLTGDTMTILGQPCLKATTTFSMAAAMGMRTMRSGGDSSRRNTGDTTNFRNRMMQPQKVEAWFTDAIQTSAGPDTFFGLPGLIMALSVDDGTVVYKALSIEKPAGNDLVAAPTKGKKITREEYRKMMQQQFAGQGGPGGQRQMRIITQ
jgi:GLPGLI family protein